MLAAHPQPALLTGLMTPAWRPTLCIWGVILDLTWSIWGLVGINIRTYTLLRKTGLSKVAGLVPASAHDEGLIVAGVCDCGGHRSNPKSG